MKTNLFTRARGLLVLLLLTIVTTSAWGDSITFNPSTDKGTNSTNGTSSTADSFTKNGFTVTSSNGPLGNGSNYRVYNGGTFSISIASGTITAISFSFSSSSYTGGFSTSYSSLSTTSWSGSATSQARITSITVTYSAEVAEYDITLSRNGITEVINDVEEGTDLDNIDGTGAQGGCSAWEFIGWSKTQRAAQNNTTAMTLVTEVDDAGPYYAVYRHTESGGGSSSETFTFSDIADANSWTNGTAYTEVTLGDVTIEAAGGGNNGKWYTSSGGSWRMYSGGTVNITSSAGDITAVTSSPSCTFTISDGAASFSPSARTDFTEIVVTYEGGDTYYYSTTATCCQNLGTINGSKN